MGRPISRCRARDYAAAVADRRTVSSKMQRRMSADALCAALPALLEEARTKLPEAQPMGIGVVRAADAGRVLFAYVDAFGSTGYLPRPAELPAAFRPRAAEILEVAPGDFASNPAGLVESRLLHAG